MTHALPTAAILLALLSSAGAQAATAVPFTVNTSETVTVNTAGGTPRLQLDVGGVTRYATYTSGSGTAALTFTYTTQPGDIDLDGIAVSSPLQLNGGTIVDTVGNALSPLTFTVPTTSGIRVDHPSVALDFVANDYIFNGTHCNSLTSFLTAAGGSFVRPSAATYYNAAGTIQTAASGVPRFDYDPVTHAAKGILLEESRTNFIPHSDCKTGVSYSFPGPGATDSGIDMAVTAPDGSTGARLWTVATAGGNNRVGNTVSGISGTSYTGSVWIKTADGATRTGTAIDVNDSGVRPITITPTWTRFVTTAATANSYRFFDLGNMPAGTYHIWGYQLETGAFPTSYIPTTAATATRATDELTLPSGAWFNAAAGTLYSDFAMYETNIGYRQIMSIASSDGVSDRISLGYSTDRRVRAEVSASGTLSVTQFLNPASSMSYNVYHKGALSYASRPNIASLAVDGAAASGNGSGSGTFVAPAVSIMAIGFRPGNAASFAGWMRSARYYPLSVADAQMQLMTQ